MLVNHIYCGNCLDVMKTMDDNSIDAIVTDLPLRHLIYEQKMGL